MGASESVRRFWKPSKKIKNFRSLWVREHLRDLDIQGDQWISGFLGLGHNVSSAQQRSESTDPLITLHWCTAQCSGSKYAEHRCYICLLESSAVVLWIFWNCLAYAWSGHLSRGFSNTRESCTHAMRNVPPFRHGLRVVTATAKLFVAACKRPFGGLHLAVIFLSHA